MSADFIEDAFESLMTADETRCVAIAWLRDTTTVHRCAHLATVEQVEWARAKVNELLDDVAAKLTEGSP
jgi:hypothetical protein